MPGHRFDDVRWFAEVDSTNRVAADLARAAGGAADGSADGYADGSADGSGDGIVVGADHQTAGRGRRGRSWASQPGGALLVSVVLRPAPPLVTLAAGVAAAEACETVAGVAVGLKWPNDLLVDGGKVGGLLAELVGDAVVVGLGVNLAWAPEGAARLGAHVDRDRLLAAYLAGLDAPGDVLSRYRARCTTIGRRVRVSLPAGTVEGMAGAVDDEGRLVVEGRPVSAGDVVHLR